jgi:hypothetical protein
MEIYKYKNLDNGDILLEKVNINTNNYIIENKGSGDKILRKIQNVNITDISVLKNYDFKKSSILSCEINDNTDEIKLKYKPILDYVYKIINNGAKIIKNTKINIRTIKKLDEGFTYNDELGISIQGVDSNKCLYEILHQCIENEINIKLQIKTFDNLIININLCLK